MNIQSVRLDVDVCGPVNQLALDSRRTVTELVNEVLREYLKARRKHPDQTGWPAVSASFDLTKNDRSR
jgi:predicted transcriptional regulator